MQGRVRRREAGIQDGHTSLRRGEEGGAGPDWSGGGRPLRGEAAATPEGGVPLPATGVPRNATRNCWKEQYKVADAYAEVGSVSRPRQYRMGLTG